jgi:hypothetical protein
VCGVSIVNDECGSVSPGSPMAVELYMHSSASLMNTTVYTLGQSKVECSLPSRRLSRLLKLSIVRLFEFL